METQPYGIYKIGPSRDHQLILVVNLRCGLPLPIERLLAVSQIRLVQLGKERHSLGTFEVLAFAPIVTGKACQVRVALDGIVGKEEVVSQESKGVVCDFVLLQGFALFLGGHVDGNLGGDELSNALLARMLATRGGRVLKSSRFNRDLDARRDKDGRQNVVKAHGRRDVFRFDGSDERSGEKAHKGGSNGVGKLHDDDARWWSFGIVVVVVFAVMAIFMSKVTAFD